MDIIELLKYEHSEILNTIEKIVISVSKKFTITENLFEQLTNELNGYMSFEEKFLYPKLGLGLTHSLINESNDRNQKIKFLLEDLSLTQKNDSEWLNKLKLLKNSLINYFREKGNGLFAFAREKLDYSALDDLSKTIMLEKKSLRLALF